MSEYQKYKYVDNLSLKSKLRRLFWELIYILFFRPTPRFALNSWRIFLLRTFGAKVGHGCRVLPTCFVWAPWNLEMGDYSVLAEGVNCYSMDKITIGSKVAVSQRAFLCCGSHDISSYVRPLITKPIFLGDHVWVCAEAFIGPGVNVEKGGVIAARSVVVKDIEAMQVVAGNPAKLVKYREVKER